MLHIVHEKLKVELLAFPFSNHLCNTHVILSENENVTTSRMIGLNLVFLLSSKLTIYIQETFARIWAFDGSERALWLFAHWFSF